MKTNLIILGIISLVLLSIHLTATATQAKKPSACSSDQHRAFDFWISEWEVAKDGGESWKMVFDGIYRKIKTK